MSLGYYQGRELYEYARWDLFLMKTSKRSEKFVYVCEEIKPESLS